MARGPPAATRIRCCGLAACSSGSMAAVIPLPCVFAFHTSLGFLVKMRQLSACAMQVLGDALDHLSRPQADYALPVAQRTGQQLACTGARGAGRMVAPVQQHLRQFCRLVCGCLPAQPQVIIFRPASAASGVALALCTVSSTEASGGGTLYRCGRFGRYTKGAV